MTKETRKLATVREARLNMHNADGVGTDRFDDFYVVGPFGPRLTDACNHETFWLKLNHFFGPDSVQYSTRADNGAVHLLVNHRNPGAVALMHRMIDEIEEHGLLDRKLFDSKVDAIIDNEWKELSMARRLEVLALDHHPPHHARETTMPDPLRPQARRAVIDAFDRAPTVRLFVTDDESFVGMVVSF